MYFAVFLKQMCIINNRRCKVEEAVIGDAVFRSLCFDRLFEQKQLVQKDIITLIQTLACSVFSLLPACSKPFSWSSWCAFIVTISVVQRVLEVDFLFDWYICWKFTNDNHAAQHNRQWWAQRQSLKDKGRSWWCAVGLWPWRGYHHNRSPKKEEKEGR